jgi:hypothetical protein
VVIPHGLKIAKHFVRLKPDGFAESHKSPSPSMVEGRGEGESDFLRVQHA